MKPIDFNGFKNFRVFNDQNGIFEELSSINLLTEPIIQVKFNNKIPSDA
ncbi:hypothetical protein SD960_02325 [Flavobacterium sp. MMLR14_040]|nr:hypothetical protein [Flavobacterium sp. MMLR14_040]MDW8848914.1 hypothetical protein [Flavobacterium sp. MMLR14_040]